MENRIRSVRLVDHRLNPVEAEIWVAVQPEQPADLSEVRGRFMGPHALRRYRGDCLSVASVARDGRRGCGFPGTRLIPEPSLWEPQTPFLYFGPVELWQDGQRRDQVHVNHGLRTLQLGPAGLRRQRPAAALARRSAGCAHGSGGTALHDRGVNLVLTDVRPETAAIWDIADRFGLLMLGRLRSAAEVGLALGLAGMRPCWVGCWRATWCGRRG